MAPVWIFRAWGMQWNVREKREIKRERAALAPRLSKIVWGGGGASSQEANIAAPVPQPNVSYRVNTCMELFYFLSSFFLPPYQFTGTSGEYKYEKKIHHQWFSFAASLFCNAGRIFAAA